MKKLIGAAVLSAATLSFGAVAKVNPNLDIDLSVNQYDQSNLDDIFVNVRITNIGDVPQKVLKWYLPNAEGDIEDGIFSISVNGGNVPYVGRHYKRGAPAKRDYRVIKPGETWDYKVEISQHYDMSEAGVYTVQYEAGNFQMFDIDNGKPEMNSRGQIVKQERPWRLLSDESAVFNLTLDRDPIFANAKGGNGGGKCNPKREDCGGTDTGDVAFTGACSNTEQTQILSALDSAKAMANDSVAYLNGNAGARYTTWFGDYTSSRFNTVAGNFDAIKGALDNESKTFDCSCNQSYFAYVYPTQPYKIYLCRAFWSANETGTDSRAGTIIHEMSHFNVVAGTDDIVYGQSGAKNLAITNPNDAIKNADSHEYFAENTPNLN